MFLLASWHSLGTEGLAGLKHPNSVSLGNSWVWNATLLSAMKKTALVLSRLRSGIWTSVLTCARVVRWKPVGWVGTKLACSVGMKFRILQFQSDAPRDRGHRWRQGQGWGWACWWPMWLGFSLPVTNVTLGLGLTPGRHALALNQSMNLSWVHVPSSSMWQLLCSNWCVSVATEGKFVLAVACRVVLSHWNTTFCHCMHHNKQTFSTPVAADSVRRSTDGSCTSSDIDSTLSLCTGELLQHWTAKKGLPTCFTELCTSASDPCLLVKNFSHGCGSSVNVEICWATI